MNLREHLLERHLDPSAYSVFLDDEEGMATFLLFDLSGRVVGYQQYRPNAPKMLKNDPREGRYYTYVTGKKEERQIALWGFESWDFSPGLLFLTEGIFDAVRLHNLGLTALATLSNDPKFIRPWLVSVRRHVVSVCDEGPSGVKLAKFGHESLVCSAAKDLGDMTDSEVREMFARWL